MFGQEDRAIFRQGDEAFDLIRQLPDVAGPVIQQQVLHRLFRDAEVGLVVLGAVPLQEVMSEQWNFLPALPQGGDLHVNNINSKE